MAKNNSSVNEVTSNTVEENEATQVSDEVAPVRSLKKKDKQVKSNDASKKKKAGKDSAPKRSRVKETLGELKKVTWPSFGKAMKQTGMVLSIVLVFGVLVLGLDLLISYVITLLSSI